VFTTCVLDITAYVHFVSQKVIVGIRGLIEDNNAMKKQTELDSVVLEGLYNTGMLAGIT